MGRFIPLARPAVIGGKPAATCPRCRSPVTTQAESYDEMMRKGHLRRQEQTFCPRCRWVKP